MGAAVCVNYVTVSRQICFDWFRTPIEVNEDWRDEIYQDYSAPFIVHDEHGQRKGMVGSYGFVPQRHRPFKKLTREEEAMVEKAKVEGKKVPTPKRIALATMNARAEEVGSKVNYKRFWLAQQLCIVPAWKVFEPNWETGGHERWAVELAAREPIALPGMWRTWQEEDGTITNSFTHFTLNADEHPLLKRFHRPGEEKRGIAILRPEHYDDWLGSTNPEFARALLELYPAEQLYAYPAAKAPATSSNAKPVNNVEPQSTAAPATEQKQNSLF
ncbi:SOS response-associated peptidase family protein [Duganella sp. LjRoot269]|uniref:SOS response-associated peptidase family protein n=1 Tax=Duganella sp. LjRoot269 TaxID=3342305 RepID=UPI003ECDBBF6